MNVNALTSTPQRPIQDRLNQLHSDISELGEVLIILEEKLSPVLSSIPEQEGDTPKALTNCMVESELVQASTRICSMIHKVRSINTRNQL
jgi:hypothetical protein